MNNLQPGAVIAHANHTNAVEPHSGVILDDHDLRQINLRRWQAMSQEERTRIRGERRRLNNRAYRILCAARSHASKAYGPQFAAYAFESHVARVRPPATGRPNRGWRV